MTMFRNEMKSYSRNAQDFRVLLVGIVCTMLIFSGFTAYDAIAGVEGTVAIHIDLVQIR